MRTLRNFVNGDYADTASGETTSLVNPSTGEEFARAPLSRAEDVDRAFAAASKAFKSWGETTPSERSLALIRIADALEARADDLVKAESENTGKPFALTMSEEIPPMVDQIRFFAGAARLLQGLSAGEYLAGHTSVIRREPVGVCGSVTPWNYPLMMAVWKWAPAIAAGNSLVLKPSDTTPVSTLLMAEIMAEHLPPGVFNVICGDRDTGRALVTHPTPAMVSITGSVRAGMEVAAAASADLKRVHLELGGKAPVVVFDDADLERRPRDRWRRLLQRRAGLHGGDEGARRTLSHGLRRGPGRAGPQHENRRDPTSRTPTSARSTIPCSSSGSTECSSASPITPGSSRAVIRRATAASCSSRRS